MDAYVNYIFQISVHEWYTAFSSGFLKVCGGKVLELFQPSELRAMMVGNSNYNWEELEEVSIFSPPRKQQWPGEVCPEPHLLPSVEFGGLLHLRGHCLLLNASGIHSVHYNLLIYKIHFFPFCLLGQTAIYKGDYSATHPTVKLFWETFHEFPLEKKKKFLCKYQDSQCGAH